MGDLAEKKSFVLFVETLSFRQNTSFSCYVWQVHLTTLKTIASNFCLTGRYPLNLVINSLRRITFDEPSANCSQYASIKADFQFSKSN